MAGEVDEEAYALHRFLSLAAEGQTVAMDMLFAPPSAILSSGMAWEIITENRHRLLTKRSASFVGYCRTQANKYGVRGDRVEAVKAAAEFFEFWLVKLGTVSKVADIQTTYKQHMYPRTFTELMQPHGALMNIIDLPTKGEDGAMLKHFMCCNKKVPFTNSIKSAAELYRRIYDDYGHRARAAASNHGIDWKALSHAVRIADEAIELLTTGHITFPLLRVDHIKAIKAGELSYDEVSQEVDDLLEKIEQLAPTSVLPEDVDREWIDNFVVEEYAWAIKRLNR